jgi:hypothetical protein
VHHRLLYGTSKDHFMLLKLTVITCGLFFFHQEVQNGQSMNWEAVVRMDVVWSANVCA